MNLNPFAYRLPAPSELFRRFMPQAQVPPMVSGPKTPKATSVTPLALSLAAATARSQPVLNFVSSQVTAVPFSSSSSLALPPRPANAPSGSAFFASIGKLKGAAREDAILQQILSGNVPEHQRRFKELTIQAKGADGQSRTATVRALPDYLAIGSSSDYVLVPMTPLTAQKIADATGSSLPTRKLVNEIYTRSEVKLAPRPKPPGAVMMSTGYFAEHSETIRKQRLSAGASDGQLIGGHKKDVVISNRLSQKPGTVAIYGWHQPNGKPIQPLSTIHEDTYSDYSHGVRLIGGSVRVDGVERPIAEVLADPNLAPLLSDEGPIRQPRVKLQ
ncbi:MAG: hypothetical protein CVV27_04160 [Candidatus Melainabacteria bacterium HGW-Melainabacteria-1]|nr:MAG: hypothetical protein CVV27_04160 [Candidatus Melainabacteria bacterium HGW-Melainabacteria-1]